MEILITFRHGLGDAVQLTSVLGHLKHYHPDWQIDVAALRGKHPAFRGLCRRTPVLGHEDERQPRYDRIYDLDWNECPTCYRDWPSIKAELARRDDTQSQKLLNPEKLPLLARRYRRLGKTIVFTNGCFDLLHAGHARLLAEAAALGDVLIVGLNSDRSAARAKGPGRPLTSEQHRAAVLAAASFDRTEGRCA